MLEIWDFESRGIVLCLCSENKGADQLRGDLRFAFTYVQKAGFLTTLHNILNKIK